jgi:hypothetical protein
MVTKSGKSALRASILAHLAVGSLVTPLASAEGPTGSDTGWKSLFSGKDLDGWQFRNPNAKKVWIVCDQVRLDPSAPGRLLPEGSGEAPSAALLCMGDGSGSDIMTEEHFYDYQLHLEFVVPRGGNSGVYNRGLFEIQIYDSYGVDKLSFHDCGALYERAIPSENHARAPGVWQSYDITMKGKKLTLHWNEKLVYKDMDVRYGQTDRETFERLKKENTGKPETLKVKLGREKGTYIGFFGEGGTRSSLDGSDRPGPIMLQGDHGPVAFRNLRIRRLDP